MIQTGFTSVKTPAFRPKGFALIAGLCIFWGAYGLISQSVLWLLPIGKTFPSQPFVGIVRALVDLVLLLGGIYVLRKQNWARLLLLAAAVAKILDWLYSAVAYRWLFSLISLTILSLPSLLVAIVIAVYFSRPSVKAYMD